MKDEKHFSLAMVRTFWLFCSFVKRNNRLSFLFGSSSDYDAAVYEKCTHESSIPLDLNSLDQCQFIAPNFIPGDSSKCECCSDTLPVDVAKNSKQRIDILRCTLASNCQRWMHQSCPKNMTSDGQSTNVYVNISSSISNFYLNCISLLSYFYLLLMSLLSHHYFTFTITLLC